MLVLKIYNYFIFQEIEMLLAICQLETTKNMKHWREIILRCVCMYVCVSACLHLSNK